MRKILLLTISFILLFTSVAGAVTLNGNIAEAKKLYWQSCKEGDCNETFYQSISVYGVWAITLYSDGIGNGNAYLYKKVSGKWKGITMGPFDENILISNGVPKATAKKLEQLMLSSKGQTIPHTFKGKVTGTWRGYTESFPITMKIWNVAMDGSKATATIYWNAGPNPRLKKAITSNLTLKDKYNGVFHFYESKCDSCGYFSATWNHDKRSYIGTYYYYNKSRKPSSYKFYVKSAN